MAIASDTELSPVRFLDAFRLRPSIARAARLAGVHRASVYRWMAATCAFSAAMKAAAEVFFREHRAKVLADEAARQRWRDAREKERQMQTPEDARQQVGYTTRPAFNYGRWYFVGDKAMIEKIRKALR